MPHRPILAALAVACLLAGPVGAGDTRGIASTYGHGDGFNGRRTACGTIFSEWGMTAAHPTLPCGSVVRVIALSTMKQVDVTITDRGPFVGGRIIDLAYGAAVKLGMGNGTAKVLIVPHR